MESIIQTLTLATILLIIGLTCTVVGIVGLAWKARRNTRWTEQTGNAATSSGNVDNRDETARQALYTARY